MGLTKEEFDKGLNDFLVKKQSQISKYVGQSHISVYHEYVQHLISNYFIEKRDEKINDLLK